MQNAHHAAPRQARRHTAAQCRMALAGVLLACLSGCAGMGEKVTGWLSTDSESYAVLGGRILSGKTNFPRDRQGNVSLQAVDGAAPLQCSGSFVYLASTSGNIELSCSDGRTLRLGFMALGPVSGIARGTQAGIGMSFTYGLAPDKAAGYLGVPAERLPSAKPATPPSDSTKPAAAG